MVEEFLSQRGVSFTKRDVSVDAAAASELVKVSGQMGVPVTIIGGQVIVGFDRAKLEQAISKPPKLSFGASIADAGIITARQGTGIVLGAYIGKIKRGSTAEKAGLMAGDIVIEINLQNVDNAGDFENAVSRMVSGSRFSLVFLRGDSKLTAEGVY